MKQIRMVARVTDHSIPYLVSVAYGIPLEEMARGVGWDVLPYDQEIKVRKLREHISNQYVYLTQFPPEKNLDDELE
jgi:hypothetical protein